MALSVAEGEGKLPRWLLSRSFLGTILLIIVMLFLIRCTVAERVEISSIEKGLREALSPIQSGFMFLWKGTQGFFGYFAKKSQLMSENEALHKQIRILQWENNQLLEYRQEAKRLRTMLDFKQNNNQYEFLAARVIGRSASNWYRTILLNRGSKDGVAKDMAVITPEGLVGRIITVTPHTSEVLLITDREGPVGVIVLLQGSRIPGIVEGAGDGSDTLLMRYISYDAPIGEGQFVVTSGLGNFYPKGIRVGRVQSIVEREAEPNALQKYAVICPEVNFDLLEEVFIIKQVYNNDLTESNSFDEGIN